MTRRFVFEQAVSAPSRQARAGIVFLPAIQVIAIIAILIGLLLPAVQKVRESAAASSASGTLYRVCQAAETYQSSHGVYPLTLLQLGSLINDPVLLLTGTENGYRFTITEATASAWMAQAEPVVPGVTGSDGFVVDQNCNETASPVPGADVQRQLMFSQILAFGAEKIAGLLVSNPAEVSQVRNSIESPSAAPTVFQTFSAQTGQVSLSSMLKSDQYPEPLRSFLAFLPQAMHLGAGNENVNALPGVSLAAIAGPSQPGVLSYQGICALTQLYETSPMVTHSLCTAISAAQVAEQQNNAAAKATMLNAYVSQIEAQTGKTLTAHQASVLMTLVKAL
jgi:type II secretory pathway pseudopilin PulG